jgi:hypothetical protein
MDGFCFLLHCIAISFTFEKQYAPLSFCIENRTVKVFGG